MYTWLRATAPGCLIVATCVAAMCGCQHGQPRADDALKTSTPASGFAKSAQQLFDQFLAQRPALAVSVGYHQYDGQLPDVSDGALKKRVQWLKQGIASLLKYQPKDLKPIERIEQAVLLARFRGDLFELERLKKPWRNPMTYADALNLVPYVSRAYAPIDVRAKAVMKLCGNVPRYLAEADKNVAKAVPRSWLKVALLQTAGIAKFVENDLPQAFAKYHDKGRSELKTKCAVMTAALRKFESALKAREPHANEAFALGEKAFLDMLHQTQGIKMTVAELEALNNADLKRNLAAMAAAAKKLNPNKPTAEVVASVTSEKPASMKAVYDLATAQGKRLRQMLIDKKIVTIPSEDVALVKPTPPFMRYNSAFLSTPGPFEKKALPAFYYISPPNPTWSKADQAAYVPAINDLLFTSVHELWPGHFLDDLHVKRNPSRILKSFWGYTRGEGWAHYAEELMLEQGLDAGDPKVVVGQLTNALLRNVRFMAAIALHTKPGTTVKQVAELFRKYAYTDPATAREQAQRGTFDPMYLSYTLGKLLIKKLRADWKAKQGDAYTQQRFHDAFLSCCGTAPIPVIRTVLMGTRSP